MDTKDTPVKVSICCISYNHKDFIQQSLDGLLMQITSFPFEILIHDDASTDGTTTIIQEYESKYPEQIRVVYQQINQYSTLTKAIYTTYLLPIAKGEYIAICEGDDYWIDPYKLQKQLDFLDHNPDFSACFHAAKVKDISGKDIGNNKAYNSNRIVSVSEIIRFRPMFFSTASLVYRKNAMQNYPDFCLNCHVGDYPLLIWLSLFGKVFYLNQYMSVYRTGHDGSWSIRNNKISLEDALMQMETMFNMWEGFDRLTGYQYHKLIQRKKMKYKINILWKYNQYITLRDPELRPYFIRISIKRVIKMFYKMYFSFDGIYYSVLGKEKR